MPIAGVLQRLITGVGSRLSSARAATAAPRVKISAPTADAHAPVLIRYSLADNRSQRLSLAVAYSTDRGRTFHPATEAPYPGSQGRTHLASSPTGVAHLFAWAAGADLHHLPAGPVAVRLTASTGPAHGSATTVPFRVLPPAPAPAPHPPTVRLDPLGATVQSPVQIHYTVADAASLPVHLVVSYSTDRGATFRAASEASGAGSEGLSGLGTSPAGVRHLFVWDAAADLHQAGAPNVLLRVAAADPHAQGAPATSPPVAVAAVAPAARPSLMGWTPPSSAGPTVPLRFVLSHPDSELVDVNVEFKVGTQAFKAATPAADSDRMQRMPAPAVGAAYRFVWNAAADGVTQSQAVQLRLTPTVGGVAGAAFETGGFAVDTADKHRPPDYQAPVAAQAAIAKMTGDGQKVVAGQQCADVLMVRVTSGGQPLQSVRVAFTLDSGGPAGSIERDAQYWTTTDGDGNAGARFRPAVGASGVATVRAQVVGTSVSATFTLTVVAPRIVHVNAPASPLWYGRWYEMQLAYNGDGSLATSGFLVDPLQPVALDVTATNALVSHRRLLLPRDGFQPTLTIVPTTLDSPVTVTVTDPTGAAPAVQFTLSVTTPPNVQRRTAIGPPGSEYTGLRLILLSTSGIHGDDAPVAYGGLTLDEAFNFQLIDETRPTPTSFTQTDRQPPVTSGCLPAQPAPLSVGWSCSSGTVWTARGARTDGAPDPSYLSADIGVPVFFTPSGHGPWWVRASIIDRPLDPTPVEFRDSGGNCVLRENTLNTFPGGTEWAQFTVLVQAPRDVTVVDAATATPKSRVREGDTIKVRLDGLSPIAGGTAEDLVATSLHADGAAPYGYTYAGAAPASTEQPIPVAKVSSGRVESAPILLVPNHPVTATPATGGKLHAACTRGWLRFHNGGVELPVAVDGRRNDRRRLGSTEALQETTTQTTPAGGAAGTVALASGELVHRTVDLAVPCRARSLLWARTYRSQARITGPLGPGWSFDHGDFLDLGNGNHRLRWHEGSGRYDDFVFFPYQAPFGHLYDLSWNLNVDDDTSPYVLLDPHRNAIHFNGDGTLRFVRDRLGNTTRYEYDAGGRLAAIVDCFGRRLTLEYWQKSDPVAPETVGCVKRVTDHVGRAVDYEYYAVNDRNGGPGFLRKVSLPAAPTFVSGRFDPAYRRSESYVYEVNATDPLEARLLQIKDSEDRAWLTTRYEAGRVKEQDFGADPATGAVRTFSFAYDSAPRRTTVTDRGANVTVYEFPDSPYCDAAAPTKVTEKTAGGDRVWQHDYDHDGFLVHTKAPTGQEAFWVYQPFSPLSNRQRGNLLATRIRASGRERVWSYEYGSGDFNLVSRAVGPEGNLAGANSETTATTFWYGSRGELLEVLPPRTHQLVMRPAPAGGLMEEWFDDTPVRQLVYNQAGLLKRSADPHGAVTEYRYYPESDPTGTGGGAASPDGGGFLAEVVRDVTGGVNGQQVNPRRDAYLAGIPPEPLKTTYKYDTYGNLSEIAEPAGAVSSFADDLPPGPNALGEVTKLTRSSPAAFGSIVRRFGHDTHGQLFELRLEGVGAGPAASATSREQFDRDAIGNVVRRTVTGAGGDSQNEEWHRDANDELLRYRPPGITAGKYPSSGIGVERDERGLAKTLRAGVAVGPATQPQPATAPLLEARLDYAPNGQLGATTAPGGEVFTRFTDEFGATHAVVDPLHNVMRMVPDGAGDASRGARIAGDGTPNTAADPLPAVATDDVTEFVERRSDELGRPTRVHHGLFAPGGPAPSGAQAIDKAADSFPDPSTLPQSVSSVPWPPVPRTALADGPWGKRDGRVTADACYDALGRATRIVDDELGTTRIRYDAHGRVVALTTPSGDEETYTYDLAGRAIELKRVLHSTSRQHPDAKTFFSRVEYDGLGRVVKLVDGAGDAIRYEYDDWGEHYTTLDAVGPDSSDPPYNGSKLNAEGNVTTSKRDDLGRLERIETKLTAGGVGGAPKETGQFNQSGIAGVGFEWEPGVGLSAVLGERGDRMEVAFDDYGRAKSVTYKSATGAPESKTQLDYDPNGRLEHVTDARGTTLHHEYDGLGRQAGAHVDTPATGLEGSMGFSVVYQRDGSVVVTDTTTQRKVSRTYDSLGRLVKEAQGKYDVSFAYDGVGRRTGTVHPAGGGTVEYRYAKDGSGRLEEVLDGGRTIAQFEHLGADVVLTRVQPGLTTTATVDPKTCRLATLSSDTVGQIDFAVEERDRLGRIKGRSRSVGPTVERTKWSYDSAGRVRQEVFNPSTGFGSGNETLDREYDADGVLRRETRLRVLSPGLTEKVTITNDREERGRITKQTIVTERPVGQVVGNRTVTIGYDANGNLVDDGTNRYVYDAWDRLIRVERAGTAVASFEYDPFGRCVKRTAGQRVEDYVYEGWQLIEARVNNQIAERYVYGEALDDLLAVVVGTTTYYVVYSPEGHVDSLVGEQHDVRESYHYSLRGEVTVLDQLRRAVGAAAPAGPVRPLSRFLFKGRAYDPDTGLYDFRSRWFHPGLGQFLTPDPLGPADVNNMYALSRNDPVNLDDPSGLLTTGSETADHFIGGVAGAGANVGSGMRMFFYDWWARAFDSGAATRIRGAQGWVFDYYTAVYEGRATKWIQQGIDQRMNAMARAELEGRYYDAAYMFGDMAMNVAAVIGTGIAFTRACFSIARTAGIYSSIARATSVSNATRVALGRLRGWATTYGGVGVRLPFGRRGPVHTVTQHVLKLRAMRGYGIESPNAIGPTWSRAAGTAMALEPTAEMSHMTIRQCISSPEALADLLKFGQLWDYSLRRTGELWMGTRHWFQAGEGPGGIDPQGPGGIEGGGEGVAFGEVRITEKPEGLVAEMNVDSGTYGTVWKTGSPGLATEPMRQWYPAGPEIPMRAMLVAEALKRLGIVRVKFSFQALPAESLWKSD